MEQTHKRTNARTNERTKERTRVVTCTRPRRPLRSPPGTEESCTGTAADLSRIDAHAQTQPDTHIAHTCRCTHTHRVGGCEMLRDDFVLRLEVLAVATPAHAHRHAQTGMQTKQTNKQANPKANEQANNPKRKQTSKQSQKKTNKQDRDKRTN